MAYNPMEEPNVESLLGQTHPEGKYQRWLLLILSLLAANCACIIYSLGFVFYQPEFRCITDKARNLWRVCSEVEACGDKFGNGFTVFSPRTSLITEYSLYCEKGDTYSRCISFLFCYTSIASFVCSLGIDSAGRRASLLGSVAMMAVFAGLALARPTVAATTFALANLFVAYDLFFNCAAILINETVGGALRAAGNSIVFCVFSSAAALFFFANAFVADYKAIFWVVGLAAAAMLPFALRVFESPVFLLRKGKVNEMYSVLSSIARINNAPFAPQPHLLQPLNASTAEPLSASTPRPEARSVWSQLRGHRLAFLALALLYVNLSMNYSLGSIASQFIGNSSIYVNGVLMSLVETFAYLVMSKYASRVPRKKSCLATLLIFIIGGGSLFLTSAWPSLRGLETIICLILKLVLCLNVAMISTYVVESLPGGVRGFCFATMALMIRLACSGLGVVVTAAQRSQVNPFAFVAVSSVLPLLGLFALEETLGKNLPQ